MDTLSRLRAGELAGATRLDLSCGLTEFPPEVFQLADTLEVLNLSGNALETLPDDLHRLHRLRVLFGSYNPFTELPAAIGRCRELHTVGFRGCRIQHVPDDALPPSLRALILTDNQLSELPASIARCRGLLKLMLSGNHMHRLPHELPKCSHLELLRIAANRFEQLPDSLLAMPRLAWLACAGNPFCDPAEAAAVARHPAHSIAWPSLQLQARLGEGASGVIHLARWKHEGGDEEVAVKLFKSAITSDGLPRSEMAACIAAGEHSGLIGVLGRIAGHPDGAQGLVMHRIGEEYRVLAGPPSLQSSTRDVHPVDEPLPLLAIQGIAHAIASAAEHLHERGILHGDLYAHNVLWNGNTGLLGDFGAASFYDTGDVSRSTALQRVEVRAFGCLLEELLTRCAPAHEDIEAATMMAALRDECLRPTPAQRPLFGEIRRRLDDLLPA